MLKFLLILTLEFWPTLGLPLLPVTQLLIWPFLSPLIGPSPQRLSFRLLSGLPLQQLTSQLLSRPLFFLVRVWLLQRPQPPLFAFAPLQKAFVAQPLQQVFPLQQQSSQLLLAQPSLFSPFRSLQVHQDQLWCFHQICEQVHLWLFHPRQDSQKLQILLIPVWEQSAWSKNTSKSKFFSVAVLSHHKPAAWSSLT